jgi:multidrug efflux system membrane fusion protein
VDAWNRDNSIKLASGELQTVDNQIDSTTGTSKLKAVFPNKDNTLFPQQFVNIRLKVDTLIHKLVVPVVAVQNGQQGTFVYTVDPETSRVHLKTVQVGITDEVNAEIRAGLTESDQVVVDGTDRLDEGTQVRVRKPGELEAIAASGTGRRGRGGRGGNAGAKTGATGADSKTGATGTDSKTGDSKTGDPSSGDRKFIRDAAKGAQFPNGGAPDGGRGNFKKKGGGSPQ